MRYVRPFEFFGFFKRRLSGQLYLSGDEIGFPVELIERVARHGVVVHNADDREAAFKQVEKWDQDYGRHMDGSCTTRG